MNLQTIDLFAFFTASAAKFFPFFLLPPNIPEAHPLPPPRFLPLAPPPPVPTHPIPAPAPPFVPLSRLMPRSISARPHIPCLSPCAFPPTPLPFFPLFLPDSFSLATLPQAPPASHRAFPAFPLRFPLRSRLRSLFPAGHSRPCLALAELAPCRPPFPPLFPYLRNFSPASFFLLPSPPASPPTFLPLSSSRVFPFPILLHIVPAL